MGSLLTVDFLFEKCASFNGSCSPKLLSVVKVLRLANLASMNGIYQNFAFV